MDNKKNEEKLDAILEVLQNLFILSAAQTDIPSEETRTILHIDKKRVGIISKHITKK